MALCSTELPAANAEVPMLARFGPAAEVGDWLMRTTVVLVELAAAVPILASVQLAVKLAPDEMVDGTEMFCGRRSDWSGAWTVKADEL